jgi:hypothetical protein
MITNGRFCLACLQAVTAITLLLSGCTGFIDSFNYDSRLLVKVPGATFRETACAGPWKFRHIVDVPRDRDPAGQWYAAWREGEPSAGLAIPGARWRHALQLTPELVDATRKALVVYPLVIEPNLMFTRMAARVDMTARIKSGRGRSTLTAGTRVLEYNAPPSPAWPMPKTRDGKIRPAWHLDDDYSELTAAARRVGRHRSGPRVRVGILDDGFSSLQQGLPERLVDDKRGDAMNGPISVDESSLQPPGSTATYFR